MKVLRERLLYTMTARGLTFDEVAGKCTITDADKYWIESGGSGDISVGTLAEIARQLDVSVDYLLGISDVSRPLQDGALSDRFFAVIQHCWELLPPHKRAELAWLAQAAAQHHRARKSGTDTD